MSLGGVAVSCRVSLVGTDFGRVGGRVSFKGVAVQKGAKVKRQKKISDTFPCYLFFCAGAF